MIMNSYNAAALSEARLTVSQFESAYHLTTAEMLKSVEGDPRLERIDKFELMDWHYALEIIKALGGSPVSGVIGTVHSTCGTPLLSAFRYSRRQSRELVNSSELELELVA